MGLHVLVPATVNTGREIFKARVRIPVPMGKGKVPPPGLIGYINYFNTGTLSLSWKLRFSRMLILVKCNRLNTTFDEILWILIVKF